MTRAVVQFEGRVQGVGFRYTCRSISRGYEVTGFVKNLPDGRVEMHVEGDRDEIEAFLVEIGSSHLKSFIRNRSLEWQEATREWSDFHIEH